MMTKPPSKSPEPTAVLSGRSFGVEADGAGRADVPGQAESRRLLGLGR
jgi:hypothetical protein